MKIKISSIVDILGYTVLSYSCIDDVIAYAIQNNYTCLVVTENEYKMFQRLAVAYGMWDWDGAMILGIKIEKDEQSNGNPHGVS